MDVGKGCEGHLPKKQHNNKQTYIYIGNNNLFFILGLPNLISYFLLFE